MSQQFYKTHCATLTDGSTIDDIELWLAGEFGGERTTVIHCVDEAHMARLCAELKLAGFVCNL